ncbi:hypothetical protein NPIL_601271 [Nephila pilipes]|uniref:Uncharacterized protein n=1 Tax=Nephila pilipes TaxID=299642 RepID=A0A8X6QY87_NEPPI|nr:hypothetical protein NPIL_601271 [Nephila pilipes]
MAVIAICSFSGPFVAVRSPRQRVRKQQPIAPFLTAMLDEDMTQRLQSVTYLRALLNNVWLGKTGLEGTFRLTTADNELHGKTIQVPYLPQKISPRLGKKYEAKSTRVSEPLAIIPIAFEEQFQTSSFESLNSALDAHQTRAARLRNGMEHGRGLL